MANANGVSSVQPDSLSSLIPSGSSPLHLITPLDLGTGIVLKIPFVPLGSGQEE